MHARVTIGQIQFGKESEGIRLGWETVLPAARAQPGYRGLLDLFDWATGKSLVVSFWDSEADLQASEQSGFVRQQLAEVASVLTGPTTREAFSVEVLETAPGPAVVARVLTIQLNLATIDEAVATARQAICSVSRQQKGFRSALALVDRATGTDYTISLWATEEDRQASEQNSYVRDQLAKVGPFLEGPVTREAFEVVIADLPA
jgi:heme-degrading monooxygenase HmoA